MVKDPVCGMAVDKKTPPARTHYEGNEYLFCSLDCKRTFEKNPSRYTGDSVDEQAFHGLKGQENNR